MVLHPGRIQDLTCLNSFLVQRTYDLSATKCSIQVFFYERRGYAALSSDHLPNMLGREDLHDSHHTRPGSEIAFDLSLVSCIAVKRIITIAPGNKNRVGQGTFLKRFFENGSPPARLDAYVNAWV
jgi:hypothetical protein